MIPEQIRQWIELQNFFCDYSAESALLMRRVLVAFLGVLLLTSVLIANLYNLQTIRFINYQTRSNENRIKLVPITPSRGIIYDRNGILLALNHTIYQIEVISEKVDNVQDTLDTLHSVVGLTGGDITAFKKKRTRSHRFTSILVETNLSEVQVARFVVNQYHFPGVEVKGYKRRYYPYGSTLIHVIGYISKISDKDVDRLDRDGKLTDYMAMHDIGKLGTERYYEDVLHGQTGYKEVEMNNRGRVVHQLKKVASQAGHDVYLTLDLKLQQYVETLLAGSRTVVVVTDPRTSGVPALAFASSHDLNLFIDGISDKDYSGLLNDPNIPLVNRATRGVYPPASMVRPYVTVSVLSADVITHDTGLFDPGRWQLSNSEKRYCDWKKWGHDHLNITHFLEGPVGAFFYQIAYDMGIDHLPEQISKPGYGRYTGIDLAEGRAGNMPTREQK